jgi:Fibronectin type III domain
MARKFRVLTLLPGLLLAASAAQADPIITPILISVGVTGTILGASTAAVLSHVIVIAIGLGISMLSQLLFKPAQPKPSDVQTILKQATAPRFRAYGRVKVAGILMFANSKAGVFDRVIAMGSGEIDAVEEHWIDDNLVTLSGNAVSSPSQYLGKCIIEFRLGTDAPAAYSGLTAAWPDLWTAAHLGKGIPSAWMEMFQVPSDKMGDVWPQYAGTNYRQVQRGAKIRTVSGGVLSAPVWNDLASNIILDYLTHPDGLGLDISWIQNEIASWEAAQNICSEAIALAAGGTENRYRIWGVYRFDERPADILARFLQACDGMIYPTPNRGIALKVGKWETPTVTIDDDAILGFSEFGRGRDILTTANTVRARYTSPDHDYLEQDADPWVDDADVADRGEFAIDLDFFVVPSHAQCRRLQKLAAARANPDWVGRLSCNLRALPVMGERFINVEISELGISGTFEVLNVQLQIEGTIVKGVEVQIASLSAAAYDWAALTRSGDEGTPPAIPPVIVPQNTIPDPTGVVGFVLEVFGDAVRIAWDAPPDDFLEGEVRYRPVGATEWFAAPVAAGATAAIVYNIAPDTAYEFEVRHRSNVTQRVSGWVPVGALAPAQVDFNFAADEYYQLGRPSSLPALITVSRASVGYAEDLAGVWTSFASNAARRTDKGLLVEEARTNGVRNSAASGVVDGSPGTQPTNWAGGVPAGLTRTISHGTTDGIEWVEYNYAGTITGAGTINITLDSATGIVAGVGEVWTSSVWFSNTASTGVTTVTVRQLYNTAAGAVISNTQSSNLVGSTAFTRRTVTGTTPATTGRINIQIVTNSIPAGTVVNYTFGVGWPQSELGAFATSPIRTTTVAVTRAADVVSLTVAPTFESTYTLLGAGIPTAPTTVATTQPIIEAGDGTANNRWTVGRGTGAARAELVAGGVAATISGGAWAQDTSGSIAAAYAAGDQAYSLNGAAAVPGSSALAPGLPSAVRLGLGGGTQYWNGYIERVIIWPNVRLPNGELERLTT